MNLSLFLLDRKLMLAFASGGLLGFLAKNLHSTNSEGNSCFVHRKDYRKRALQ